MVSEECWVNQAVAKLNATGQWSGDLIPYAEESVRRAARLMPAEASWSRPAIAVPVPGKYFSWASLGFS